MVQFFGAALIIVGVVLNVYERQRGKNHDELKAAIDEHLSALNTSRERTRELPESDALLPGTKTTFSQVKEILSGAEELAVDSTKETARTIVEQFQREEARREPFYLASYALIVCGTILTVL